MGDRPSGVAQDGASGWYGRHNVDYCRELRTHRDEFAETRRRLIGIATFTLVLGIVIALTGRAAMAAWFGWTPTVILGLLAVGNELLLRRVQRKIATDCPDSDEPRSLP